MTVPHDAVLCLGLGVASHLASREGEPLSAPQRRIATTGFALAWLPLTCTLLWVWTEWSWWYWEPVLSSKWLAVGLGLGLECGAFALALLAGHKLRRRGQLVVLGLIAIYEALMLILPWSYFSHVGTMEELQAGKLAYLFDSWALLATIGLGGLWLIGVGMWTARRLQLSAASDPETSGAHPD